MLLSVGIALAGIRFAQRLYRVRPEMPGEIARRWPVLYDAVRNKFFVDEFYEWAVVRRVAGLADRLWQTFDARFLDGIVNGIADIVLGAGARIRRLQTGIVGGYAFSLLAGAVLLLGYILYRRAG
jgi:NADH:ubiquinone oxidoreductase subunit 5 (subunit L)/multisubunit Na+/H+ antiporter MnhA subunit